MNLNDSLELMKKYSNCPKCGNDKIGNGEGTLVVEDHVFERNCKCGWKKTEDRRIKCIAYMTINDKGTSGGVYEVSIHGYGHKYLPLKELKELAGAKRVNQSKKIEAWLNTDEGRKWAIQVPAAILPTMIKMNLNLERNEKN